jgi:hypothetical protein
LITQWNVAKRRKKQLKDDYYFGEKVETAVRVYIHPDTSQGEKNKIFSEIIYEPLQELVKSIVGRYPKYIGVIGLEELEQQAFIAVYENMHKYDPYKLTPVGKEPKAFSYYGTICRNFIKTHSVKTYKLESHHDLIDAYNDYFEKDMNFSYDIDGALNGSIYNNIFPTISNRIKKEVRENHNLKVNDIKVGESLIIIFENWNVIYGDEDKKLTPFYLKKKIYQYIKDITGLTAKDIKNSIKVYQKVYGSLLQNLIENE